LLRLLTRLDVRARHGHERTPTHVVDDLRHDVLERTEDHETRTLRGPRHLLANTQVTAMAILLTRLWNSWHGLLASRLTGLTANDLAGVLDALALVRLGRTESANLGGNLADERLIRSVDDDLGRLRRGQLDARRRLVLDGVREAERQL